MDPLRRAWDSALRCPSLKSSLLRPANIQATTDSVADPSFQETESKEASMSTTLMNFECKFDPYSSSSTPLYQTATFKQPSATECGPYDYTKSANPTRNLLAKLEKADRALCFTSGMAALTAVTRLVQTGEEIVAGEDMYGGSDRLLSQVVPKAGVVVRLVFWTNLKGQRK